MQKRTWRGIVAALAGALMVVTAGMGAGSPPAKAAYPTQQKTVRANVIVVRLPFHSAAERDKLANEWDAAETDTRSGYLTIWADEASYAAMLRQGLKPEIDQAATEAANQPVTFGGQSGPTTFDGGYRTVEEMQTFLNTYASTYPTLAQVVDIGDSWCKTHPGSCTSPAPTWNGYDLLVLHITNQSISGPKPVFWFDTGIHSREIAGPEVSMRFIAWLLDNYATNADARWLVDYHDIWVMPMLNPDGHHIVESGGNNPVSQRKNGDRDDGCTSVPGLGTDLNRNFPFLWACCGGSSASACNETYHGPSAGSEEETQAVVAKQRSLFPDQRGPNNSDPAPITSTGIIQSMHTYAALNLYAWGWTTSPSPNNADLQNIGAHMSATNANPVGNNYTYGQPPNVLYAVDGDTADWQYGELGVASYTTELDGTTFFPAYSTIDADSWPNNQGMLTYMAKIARTPYLTTRGPDSKNVTMVSASVAQGINATVNATINYAWTGNAYAQNVAAAEYYVDTPPWAGGTATAMTGTFTGQTVNVSGNIPTGSLSLGQHIVFVRGRGVNSYSGNLSWGPVTAVFFTVTAPVGTPTISPTGTITPSPTITLTPTQTPCGTALLDEGFESGTLNTFASSVATCAPGGCGWSAVATSANNGTYSAYVPDVGGTSDQSLVLSSPLAMPAVATGATLTFWHKYGFEGTSTRYDGGVLEVSTNGGSTWADVGAANITTGGYNGTLSSGGTNPLAGRQAWSATQATFTQVVVNLSSFAGQSLLFRFREGTDVNTGSSGWWIDDLRVFVPTACGGPTSTSTATGTVPTATVTQTSVAATSTATQTGVANTPTRTATQTGVAATVTTTGSPAPPTVTSTATVTRTPCPISFSDVTDPTAYYYEPVYYLACRGVVGGYADGTYRPFNNTTRGQMSKIIVLAYTLPIQTPAAGGYTFHDVPPTSTFFSYIETAVAHNIVGGYACGGTNPQTGVAETCDGTSRPYYRDGNFVTRGQLTKIVVGTAQQMAGWTLLNPATATFTDVPTGSTFYQYIETAVCHHVLGGYADGTFHPADNAFRGQIAKIVTNAVLDTTTGCGP